MNIDYGSSVPLLLGLREFARGLLGQFLPLGQIKGRVRGVYVLLKDETPVYVGQSKGVRHRVGEHRADKDFDRAVYLPVDTMHDRLRLEALLVFALDPQYNKAIHVVRSQGRFVPWHADTPRLKRTLEWD